MDGDDDACLLTMFFLSSLWLSDDIAQACSMLICALLISHRERTYGTFEATAYPVFVGGN